MSNGKLTLFSYEILGLIGRNGASAHDLRRMVARGRMLAWAGESQYYAEPKRLARLGYLDARREPGLTRERTVYTLTDEGRRALRDWARTPVRLSPVRSEALVRLLIADLAGEEAVREGILTLREDIAAVRTQLAEARAAADDLLHRRKYLLLTLDFLEGLLDLHRELTDTVERELSDGG